MDLMFMFSFFLIFQAKHNGSNRNSTWQETRSFAIAKWSGFKRSINCPFRIRASWIWIEWSVVLFPTMPIEPLPSSKCRQSNFCVHIKRIASPYVCVVNSSLAIVECNVRLGVRAITTPRGRLMLFNVRIAGTSKSLL